MKALTTKEFIKRAKQEHHDRYGYHKSEYAGLRRNIKIFCNHHNEFFDQRAEVHLQGGGCQKCAKEERTNPRKTTAQFIAQAIEVHGDKYDYTETVYKSAFEKVIINCPTHGLFPQAASSHLQRHGCPECAIDKNSSKQRTSLIDFVKKAREVHGMRYLYSNFIYINVDTPGIIVCRKKGHGEFTQSPSAHIRRQGCPRCAGNAKYTREEFIEKSNLVHNNYYSYEKFVFVNAKSISIITCPKHGDFYQQASAHLSGIQCLTCSYEPGKRKAKKTTGEFISDSRKVHGSTYGYSKTVYTGSHDPLIIICPHHGEFTQTATDHLSGYGCKDCHFKGEAMVTNVLKKMKIKFSRKLKISKKRYDFYLEEKNLILERDGEQHYRETFFAGYDAEQTRDLRGERENDKLKTKLALDADYKIARIPFWLTDEEVEQEVENILLGEPTYPNVPDLKQLKTKPKPNGC